MDSLGFETFWLLSFRCIKIQIFSKPILAFLVNNFLFRRSKFGLWPYFSGKSHNWPNVAWLFLPFSNNRRNHLKLLMTFKGSMWAYISWNVSIMSWMMSFVKHKRLFSLLIKYNKLSCSTYFSVFFFSTSLIFCPKIGSNFCSWVKFISRFHKIDDGLFSRAYKTILTSLWAIIWRFSFSGKRLKVSATELFLPGQYSIEVFPILSYLF